MQKYLRILLPTGALLSLFLVACGGEGDALQIEPTFSSIQENMFAIRCQACHNESSNQGNLDLKSAGVYERLVGVTATGDQTMVLVEAGSPEKSFLYVKMTNPGQGQGAPMPPGFQLPQPEVDAVKQWIDEGALKN